MSKVTVHSNICDFEHIIEGKRVGKNIIIKITTPCDKVQKMSDMEIPIREIMDIKENYVINKAQGCHCNSNCLVPCGVLHVCQIEAGLLSESLCKKTGSISITFD